jgi:hypothetical protein
LKPWIKVLSNYCDINSGFLLDIQDYDSFESYWQKAFGTALLYLSGALEDVLQLDRKILVKASCACARLALPYVVVGEKQPRIAIETAERWCEGQATLAEVYIATTNVNNAVIANGADYVARAARDAAWIVQVDSVYAVQAAVYVADNVVRAISFINDKIQIQQQMGDIVREIISMPRFDKLMKLKGFL